MAEVDSLIMAAQERADSTLEMAGAALTQAADSVKALGYIIPNPVEADAGEMPSMQPMPTVPDMLDVSLDLPDGPGDAPTFQDVDDIRVDAAPNFSATLPQLSQPSQPGALAAFTTQAPTIKTDLEFPEPPDQLVNPILSEPVIEERQVPVKPAVVLPMFDKAAPTFSGTPPQDLPGKMQQLYNDLSPGMIAALDDHVDRLLRTYNPRFHDQMASVEAQLARYLAGGTGFAPAVEDAIYERARDKGNAEFLRTNEAAWASAAERGFVLPDGVLAGTALMARQGLADNMARAGTDIAIKQAEIEQANLQFAVTASTGLRVSMFQAALNYHQGLIQLNGQAIELVKDVLNYMVRAYELELETFKAALDAWRAEAAVYETRLKGALALIDLYKAEIEALQALTQVDLARVNIYRARIECLQSLASVYRSRIDAVIAKADVEKTKLELFRTQVLAYSTQVEAKNSEWGGYRAALAADEGKVSLYTAQASVHRTLTDSWRAKIDAQAEVMRAKSAANQAKASIHEATVRAYSAVVSARGDVARTKLDGERTKFDAFRADVQARLGYANAAASIYSARSTIAVANARIAMDAQTYHANSLHQMQSSIASLGTSLGSVYAGVSNAAMAGINSVVSKADS